MDPTRFDHLVVVLGRRASRRSLVGLFAALGSTGLLTRDVAAACSPDGTRCGGSTGVTCCSGFCKRKRGTHKRFCHQAPSQSTCTVDRDVCVTASVGDCSVVGTSCKCFVTTSGRSFCGELLKSVCTACTTNDDCTKVTGKGSACITDGPNCCGTSPTICIPPCPI